MIATTQQTAKAGHVYGVLRAGLWVGLLLCLFAGAAHGSRIVQIRVGNHPTFTRLVFETDTPAGYQIERGTADDGSPQLIVTVRASSHSRIIQSKSVGIESVTVVESIKSSIAQIRLRKSDLVMKEMILSNPPRIVLDFEFQPVAAATPESAPRASTASGTEAERVPTVVESEPEIVEPEPISVEPKPESVRSEIAEVKPAATIESDAQSIVNDKRRAALRELIPGVHKRGGLIPERADSAASEPDQNQDEPLVVSQDTVDETSPTETQNRDTTAHLTAPTPDATPTMAAKVAELTAPRVVEKPEPTSPTSTESSFNPAVIAAAVAGVLIVAVLAVRMFRKKSASTDMDMEAFDDDTEFGSESATGEQEAGTRIPAEGFAMNEPPAVSDGGVAEENTAAYSLSEVAANITEPETGFFDENSEGEKTMDLEATNLPANDDDVSAPPMVSASGDTDITEIVQGLVGRIAGLETRLDESNEARERLERQVAAQSEELRVQRAAIARTQRALRSLSRTDEEQATEPALREPSQPAGSSEA